uniref:Putative sodium-coupled neutral amino acid transporter 10 n=1 Tax=Lygus hesperus TaxID=30085 RepID=A0A0A9Z0E3_LYGHE
MMFSFDCQALVFQIYNNLAVMTRLTMVKVSTLSVVVTGCIYTTVGIYGYMSHTPNVHGNILTNYNPLKDHLFAFAESFYSATIVIAYVLVLFPCRDAVFILLCGFNSATHELSHKAISTKDNLIVSVSLAVVSLLLALNVSSIVFIIAILGAACSSTVCYTYPGFFRLALHARGIARGSTIDIVVALLMILFGLSGCVIGTVIALKL